MPVAFAGMFIRQCYRTKNVRRHASWALVESHRTATEPRQRGVAWRGVAWRGWGSSTKPDDWVFSTQPMRRESRSSRPMRPNDCSRSVGNGDLGLMTIGRRRNRDRSKSTPAQFAWNACDKAEIPRWSPGQLRKTRATQARQQGDLETAQQVLGHSSKQTTERHYAEVDLSRAEANAPQFG